MKRMWMMVCALVLVAGVARGQAMNPGSTTAETNGSTDTTAPPPGPPHGPPSPKMELQRLTRELTLTSAEQAAILPILEKRQSEMEALRGSGLDRDAEREKHREILDATRAEIREQLTAEQQKIFDTMRGPHGPHGPGGPDGPPPPPAGGEGSGSGAGAPPQ